MRVQSKINRAKVTEDIKRQIVELITEQKDTTKKKKQKARWYREQVGSKLALNEKDNPSIRSYEETLRELRGRLKNPNPLDSHWTIGSCDKNKIPDNAISVLVEYNQLVKEDNKKYLKLIKKNNTFLVEPITSYLLQDNLTIREAKWMARLISLVEPIANKYYPKHA